MEKRSGDQKEKGGNLLWEEAIDARFQIGRAHLWAVGAKKS